MIILAFKLLFFFREEERKIKGMKHADNYKKWRKCHLCNEYFQEKDNIGQLYCRIHPGIIIFGKDRNRYYSCCGVRVDSCFNFYLYNDVHFISEYDRLGCLKIDHFDKEYLEEKIFNDNDDEEISKIDIDKRIEQIKAISLLSISDEVYKYGITKPKQECILETININDCYKQYHDETNYFSKNRLQRQYDLGITRNSKKNTPFNDNIDIDLMPICKQIDEMLSLNKDYQKDAIGNIWNENITTQEDINLYEELSNNINNDSERNFKMIKRIDSKLVYNYYGIIQ